MIGKLKELFPLLGGEWLITFTTRSDPRKMFEKLRDCEVSVEIKKHNPKRSKTANDFCWAMCTDIGNALRPPLPKEMIYRQAIRDVGRYDMLLMKNEAVESFSKAWSDKGIGWFVDVVDDSKKNPGCKVLFVYYGTSTYDSAEMSRVLDYLKQDMENMSLPIPLSREEEERVLNQWRKA